MYACGPAGCGGNFQGTIDNATVQLMCIDYQNEAFIPSVVYNANLTAFDSANADVSKTRFGGSPATFMGQPWAFTVSNIGYSGGTLNLATDQSSALARYQMVGYLASNYATASSANDDRIQSAIWQLMATDPPNTSVYEVGGSATWLSSAAQWYATTSAFQKQSLLANYRIVTNLAPQISGDYPAQIQEFLTIVPEPRYVIGLSAGLLAAAFFFRRRIAEVSKV